METDLPYTWHDPRTCTPDQFGGPLDAEITVASADDLHDLCREIGSHTLIDLPAMSPDLTWSGSYGVVQLRPDADRGVIGVSAGDHAVEVAARPVRPIEVARAMFEVLEGAWATIDAGRPIEIVEVEHFWCGTSRIIFVQSYANSDDHPLTGAAARDDEGWDDEEDTDE